MSDPGGTCTKMYILCCCCKEHLVTNTHPCEGVQDPSVCPTGGHSAGTLLSIYGFMVKKGGGGPEQVSFLGGIILESEGS